MRTSTYGRGDLHVHTLLSDGAQRPEAILEAASGRVDVVAITDHDEIRGALRARDWAHEHPELGVDVVVGEESARRAEHRLPHQADRRRRHGGAPARRDAAGLVPSRWMREVPRVLRAALVSLSCFLEVPARP